MSPLQAVVLGLVQGVTEFLPISSSAHLVLVSRFLGWGDQGLLFDMAANTGSLVAVMLYLRADLARLTGAMWSAARGRRAPVEDLRLARAVAIATVPVAVAGLAARPLIETLAREPVVIAGTTIVFALLLGWADRRVTGSAGGALPGPGGALAIGVAQAMALVPGTSRSGVTLTAGLLLGFDRERAARFSFLLAVPVGLLVAANQALDLAAAPPPAADWLALAIGFSVSCLAALAAIDWLLTWVRRQRLTVFVVYRLVIGALVLALWAL